MNSLNVTDKSKIYVFCPSNLKTGGTELLHQLVASLLKNGKKAYIAYYLEGKCDRNSPTPDAFLRYVGSNWCLANSVKDDPNNILIFPETAIGKSKHFNKALKCVWWLSVDNYNVSKGKMNRLKQYGVMSFLKHLLLNDYFDDSTILTIPVHFFQSYYAADFVQSKGVPDTKLIYLSDYINDVYLNDRYDISKKENIVLYNPKKGKEFTEKLIAAGKDIKWIPIINMTNEEVRNTMNKSKVYIDFGNHPGKDRIPREAAMAGCCIITDRRGSAAYHEDVPIPDSFKFNDSEANITSILDTIRMCFLEYDSITKQFDSYREYIANEKEKFNSDVRKIFS